MNSNIYNSEEEISICALTLYPFDTIPGQRFRIEQWEPYLKEQGINIEYYSFADKELIKDLPKSGNFPAKLKGLIKGIFRRVEHLRHLSKYDVILIYRAASIIGPAFFEKLISLSKIPIVYDFDDAIFLEHTNEANKLFGWMKFAQKTSTICRLSTVVTVGNAWLAEYAGRYNKNVRIIPSSVNTDVYLPKLLSNIDNTNNKIIVGWTGSSTSQTHLEMYAPLLKKLLTRRSVEIHIHSDRSPNLPDIPFVWHKWTPENEVEVISSFDIGIMPLPADEWSQGKCSMKALLYMSLGIPTVCSDIGMNREVIKQWENGCLATTEEEWLQGLEKLIDDHNLRNQIGAAARKTIVEEYSMKKCADLFGTAIRESIDIIKNKKDL